MFLDIIVGPHVVEVVLNDNGVNSNWLRDDLYLLSSDSGGSEEGGSENSLHLIIFFKLLS